MSEMKTAAYICSGCGLGDKLRIGVLPLASHAPTYIADGKGYFTKQGLAAELVSFEAAEPMAVAIAAGDVDFGVTAITGGLISLADKGAAMVIGGALKEEPGIEGEKILASKKAHDDGLTTPAKLKGRTFGITTAGSSFQYMAHKIAQKEGKMAVVRDHAFLCNEEGVQLIRNDIANEAVTHICIAACSRRAKTEAFHFPSLQ